MRLFFVVVFSHLSILSFAQHKLQPGFDAKEHIMLFALARYGSRFADSLNHEQAQHYNLTYQSPEVGLKNQWSLYLRDDKVGAIAIRGTIKDRNSWFANFYSAMIPATGTLYLTDSTQFDYKFATDPKAAVHVGWAVSLGFMAKDILQKINDYYTYGIKEYYIFGHSQGGAIAFLTTSYLRHLQLDGKLPEDIRFKTYCNAGPKPGNMNYAYDYDFITRGGWAYNVVNAADWVPETPYTVQRIQDMNYVNPIAHTKDLLKEQNFFVRNLGNYFYGRFNAKPRKLQRRYTKIFGNTLYRYAIKKTLSQYKKPEYYQSSNYMRAGAAIVLMPDSAYHSKFKFNEQKKDFFVHHNFGAYYYLLKKDYLE